MEKKKLVIGLIDKGTQQPRKLKLFRDETAPKKKYLPEEPKTILFPPKKKRSNPYKRQLSRIRREFM